MEQSGRQKALDLAHREVAQQTISRQNKKLIENSFDQKTAVYKQKMRDTQQKIKVHMAKNLVVAFNNML